MWLFSSSPTRNNSNNADIQINNDVCDENDTPGPTIDEEAAATTAPTRTKIHASYDTNAIGNDVGNGTMHIHGANDGRTSNNGEDAASYRSPRKEKKTEKGIIYFRPIQPTDRAVIQRLHEEWFPVDYTDDFFEALCNERTMPGSGEPLYCCVACFRALDDAEYEEMRDMGGQGITRSLLSKRKIRGVKTFSYYKGCSDFILWESDSFDEAGNNNGSYEKESKDEGKEDVVKNLATNTLPLLSTTNPPSYCAPIETFDGADLIENGESAESLHLHIEREKMKRFYSNGFRFDNDDETGNNKASNNIHPNGYLTHSREHIVGCLVGSFLKSPMQSKHHKNSSGETDPRDKTSQLLITDPERHPRMFYIMTLGTAREFRRTGLGSVLVDRVVDMIKKMPECGALYLHVITYNEGAIRLYKRLGFSEVSEIKNYYSINGVNYNCYLYSRYFNGNRGHKTIYDVIFDFASLVIKSVFPWRLREDDGT